MSLKVASAFVAVILTVRQKELSEDFEEPPTVNGPRIGSLSAR